MATLCKPCRIILIDLMEEEPPKQTFRDGIDPNALVKEFTQQFVINSFCQESDTKVPK